LEKRFPKPKMKPPNPLPGHLRSGRPCPAVVRPHLPSILRRIFVLVMAFFLLLGEISTASSARADRTTHPCLRHITSGDALAVADPSGDIVFEKNATEPFIPASILKILTAATALHYLGPAYRFKTAFYTDKKGNLKVKGFGDPLFISEIILEISDTLSKKLVDFKDLIIDTSYFASGIRIPGQGMSTNPYDAPVGALCANFNTVCFHRTRTGKPVSSESQTPLTSLARRKIASLHLKKGRHVFTHNGHDAARYAGELLLYFLSQKGVKNSGQIRFGRVTREDANVYTYHSRFTLETALRKMLKFSNNFIANQIFITVGARVYGAPGTLKKGIRATRQYLEKTLSINGVRITEGSGLSRENRLTAVDMLTILNHFKPYRYLLTEENGLYYKTGTLSGIHTRAGYIQESGKAPCAFVISLRGNGKKITALMACIRRSRCP